MAGSSHKLVHTGHPSLSAGPEVSFIHNGVRRQVPLSDAGHVAFEDCAPVRNFTSWRGKRNYCGVYAAFTTRTNIGFESLFERTALMTLDRDPSVMAISSQPMWIHWPAGSTPATHAPDYFVRHSNGDGELIDVRPERLIDDKAENVFETTRSLCAEHHYRYRVISNLSPTLDQNLRYLSRYKIEACRPEPGQIAEALPHFVTMPVRDLAQRLAGEESLARGLSWVYWAIWHGAVNADLERVLSLSTPVSATRRAIE